MKPGKHTTLDSRKTPMPSTYVLADVHSRLEALGRFLAALTPEDTVILAGDLWGADWRWLRRADEAEIWDKIQRDYGQLQALISGHDAFTVKGNWDPDCYYDFFADRDLCGQVILRHGWTITGFSEGTDRSRPVVLPEDWFKKPDPAMDEQLLATARVWISHYPPLGTLDEVEDPEFGFKENVGSQCLLEKVSTLIPEKIYCGHMHRQEEALLGPTRVFLSYFSEGRVTQVT